MQIRPWAIGVFLIAGFGLLTAILFLVGNRHKSFSRHLELYADFESLGGLANGATVRVSGFDTGQLEKIDIPKSADGKFRLKLQVQESVHEMIREDSLVSIETEGVVGDKFISIRRGTDRAPEAQNGATLPSKEPFDMTVLLEQGSGLLKDVHGTVKDINGRVDTALDTITKTLNRADDLIAGVQPNIQKISSDGRQITGKINLLVGDLNQGKGPAGLLLKDEETRRRLQDTLLHVKATAENADQASARADQMLTDFQSRNLGQTTQATLDHAQSISQNLDKTLEEALGQDNMGQYAGMNLRETLSNLDRGTTNLAEDTEALKHNFFFRGFFKRRGFYDLNELTPSEYRKACGRKENAGSRTWLSGGTLFAQSPGGQETLTAAGRQQIDSEMGTKVGTLPGRLIVVEGYAPQAGSPDAEFVQSRQRADLVRRYLLAHYHLNHDAVGMVPLLATPPPSAARDTWDGAAIMVFEAQTK